MSSDQGFSERPRRTRRPGRPTQPDAGDNDLAERILDLALEEFAEHGFAGARVKRISDAASVGLNLLYYYYYESKEGLYRAVVTRLDERRDSAIAALTTERPALPFVDGYRLALDPQNRSWLRLLMWAELQDSHWPSARKHDSGRVLAQQAAGEVLDEVPPEMLQLAQIALSIMPVLLPGLAAEVTGLDPSGETFIKQWAGLLDRLQAGGQFLRRSKR